MPVTKVYPGGSVVDGEVVESTREVTVRFLTDMMVRGTTRDDKLHMFAIFPFMNGAAVQTGDWAANEWKRLRHSPLKKDIRQMKAGWHEADLGEMTSNSITGIRNETCGKTERSMLNIDLRQQWAERKSSSRTSKTDRRATHASSTWNTCRGWTVFRVGTGTDTCTSPRART
jgi:hypothetical protein